MQNIISYCQLFSLMLCLYSPSVLAQTDKLGKPLLGIGMSDGTETYRKLTDHPVNNGAIIVKKVLVGSSADLNGFKKDDILFAINDKELDKNDPVNTFKSTLEQFQPNDSIVIKGLRFKKQFKVNNKVYPTIEEAERILQEGLEKELRIKPFYDIQSIEKEVILGSWKQMPKLKHIPASINSDWQNVIPYVQHKWPKILSPDRIQSSLFHSKMQENASINIHGADPLAYYLHNNPHELLGIGETIKNIAVNNSNTLVEQLLKGFYVKHDFAKLKPAPLAKSQHQFIEQIKQLLIEVQVHNNNLKTAFRDFDEPLARLKRYYQSQDDSHTPVSEPDFHKKLEQISLISKDYQIKSNQLLLKLRDYFSDQRIDSLKSLFNDKSLPKRIDFNGLAILISGTNNDNHYHGADLIIDLGGDDNYFVTHQSQSKPIIIDLSGNDVYMSQIDHQWASARFGVSFLLDVEGDDIYSSNDFSIGSAFIGAALLDDRNGNDSYSATHLSMGSGLLGIGILTDQSGNDSYLSGTISQAAGLFMGQGYLIEENGNDRYISTAWRPGAYQQEVSFDGISMGIGLGLRDVARGGVGILFDYHGGDYYHGGNFSLGCGYYFALGGLIDLDGDDNYQAMRYGIGSAAHSATGIFIDGNGDDIYYSSQHAIAGAAWDLSNALFIDESGDDRYQSTGPFSFAAAEHNSLAIHLDALGDDSYRNGFFDKQTNSYNDGLSFGIFVNSMGQDTYPAPYKNNDMLQAEQFYFNDL